MPMASNYLSREMHGWIVQYVEHPASLANLALVSRTWSVVANRALWRNLTNFAPLLRILLGNTYVPEHPITTETLARFNQKAALVDSIIWEDSEWTEGVLDGLADLAATIRNERPDQDLIPNLRSFRIRCNSDSGINATIPWISRSIVRMDIVMGLSVGDETSSRLLEAVGKSAKIVSLSIRTENFTLSHRRLTMETMLAVIKSLPRLENVTIPLYVSSGVYLGALAAAPYLKELSLSVVDTDPRIGSSLLQGSTQQDPMDLEGFSELRGLSRFHSLETLRIAGSWDDVVDIVKATSPPHIVELHLAVPSLEHNQVGRAVCDILSLCQPRCLSIENLLYTHIPC